MAAEHWKLESDLCRCCHGEGIFKSLDEPCKISGSRELYSEMLKYCFDINLAPVPGMLCVATYKICEACIARLQDAMDFKNQVQACEEQFRDMCKRNVIDDGSKEIAEDVIDSDDHEKHDESQSIMDKEEEPHEPKQSVLRDLLLDEHNPVVKGITKKFIKPKPKETVTSKSLEKGDNDEEKEGRIAATKFRLNEEDYKKDGDQYLCARCDKKYDKKSTLYLHVKATHYKTPRFTCMICRKTFMAPMPLTTHKLEAHNVDERFNCSACVSTFNTRVQLKTHLNNFHMLGNKYLCKYCDYESFSCAKMYKHKFKHKAMNGYHCRYCKIPFLSKATLDIHERLHTADRRKVCKVCGKVFLQKASLNYHMAKIHPQVNLSMDI